MAWDTAAGHAVLLAAGGAVTELDGAPLARTAEMTPATGLRNPHFVAWGRAAPPLPA